MAKGPDHTDNVTKLDKPVLRLKPPAKQSATAPGKTGSEHKKPRRNKADQANQNGAQPRSKSGASYNKNRKSDKAKNTASKTSTTTTLKSRSIVFDILNTVEEGTQLDKALAAHDRMAVLDGRDRRFVQLLATTYLRRRGQIEKILSPLMTRRPFGAQASANIILGMGAAQLLFLKTGAHAAVDSTVELMRQAGFESLCGLTNAVMRRLTRDGEALLATTHDAENLQTGYAVAGNITGAMRQQTTLLDWPCCRQHSIFQLPKMPRHGQKSSMGKCLMATPSAANLRVTRTTHRGCRRCGGCRPRCPPAFSASLMVDK